MSLYGLWLAVQADVGVAGFILACAALALLTVYATSHAAATDDTLRARQTHATTAEAATTTEREEPAA